VLTSTQAEEQNIYFNFKNTNKNDSNFNLNQKEISLKSSPLSISKYKRAFDKVQQHLKRGNTYLVNLTAKTEITVNASLSEIFQLAKAKYRILYKNEFVVFSPETFVKITGNKIFTYPMKGTIDAAIPNAKEKLIENKKELAEHATIVDLLRNDLSKIANNVTVEKFRYIEEIKTKNKKLLQVSSKISATLDSNSMESLGDILFSMLPAGSITGAPKEKTLKIIQDIENYKRGFYTGIAGYFDGENLDSCVLIRFIENKNGKFYYKSGGGITTQSIAEEEYQELIDKIYVPIN
nr:aminodeoxychorismate synthase component I [Prolixibacteraceae bacterium]